MAARPSFAALLFKTCRSGHSDRGSAGELPRGEETAQQPPWGRHLQPRSADVKATLSHGLAAA